MRKVCLLLILLISSYFAHAATVNVTICSGSTVSLTSVDFGDAGGETYSWSAPGAAAIAAGATSSVGFQLIFSQTLTNITSAPTVYTYTLTIFSSGLTNTVVVTVNPAPTVNAITAQVKCNGTLTNAVTFTSNVLSSSFTWSGDPTDIGLGVSATGTGNLAAFTATNATIVPIYSVITVNAISNTCVGAPRTFTITVNPTPTVGAVTDQAVCHGFSTTAVIFTGSVLGTTYNWTTSNIVIGGGALGSTFTGTGNIPVFTGQNVTGVPATALIVVTPLSNSCSGSTVTFSITVNPIPTVNIVADLTVCDAITVAPLFTGSVGAVFNWSSTTLAIGIGAASGTGPITPFTSTGSALVPVTAYITVSPLSNSCSGTSTVFSITVNPIATVNALSNIIACNNTLITPVAFTSPLAVTYNWTDNNPSIGIGVPSGSGNIAAFTGTSIVTPADDYIIVTPNYLGCSGTPTSFTITVNPTPSVNTVASQIVCNNLTVNVPGFTGSVAATYDWTSSTSLVGIGGLTGTGNIASFTSTNVGTVPLTAFITVIPSSNTCIGSSTVFSITVNPTPTVNTVADQVICNAVITNPVTFSGLSANTTFNWTNSTPSVGLALNGSGNILAFTALNASNAPVSALIMVTPVSNTCSGTPITFSITVNPTPVVNAIANQILCNGLLSSGVIFSGTVTNATYNWTNNTVSIGLAAASSGPIAAFTVTNATNAPVSALITVTAVSNTCNSAPLGFSITVNPTPSVNLPASLVICNATLSAAINFTGSAVANTTYNWTNTLPGIGIIGAGIGNISAFTTINASNVPIIASLAVTPVSNTCSGTAQNFTITINPTPNIGVVSGQVLCNAFSTTTVTFTSAVAGATFSWANTTSAIGLATSGSTTINAFTATNVSAVPITGFITASALSNSCAGASTVFSITVNPTPTVNTIADQIRCNNVLTGAVAFTGFVTSTTYNWTNSNPLVGLAPASGAGNISAFTATNISGVPITTLIVVSPVSNSCNGTPYTFSVTVNPTPSVNVVSAQAWCNTFSTTTVVFSGSVASTTFNWTNTTSSIGLTTSGSGTINAFTAVNVSAIPVTAIINVSTVSNSCSGGLTSFSITVYPTPTVNTIADQAICNNSLTAAVTFTGFVTGTTYNWTNSNSSVGLAPASGIGNISAFTGTNGSGVPINTLIVVSPVSNTCNGTPYAFSITVNPTPSVNAVSAQTLCNGLPTTTVIFSGSVASTTFNWTNTTSAIGLATSGSGTINAFAATNVSAVPITAIINVSTVSNSCSGGATAFSITVYPTPTVNTIADQAICNNFSTTTVTFTGLVTNTAYQWTNTNAAVGLAALSATGNISSFLATNGGTFPISATITVTPLSNTCTGTPRSFTITVNPTPVLTSTLTPAAICNATAFNYTSTSLTTGTIYTWNRASVAGINGGFAGSGAGAGINDVLTSSNSTTSVNVVYALTLNANSCLNNQNVTVAVNPSALLISTLTPSGICTGTIFGYTPASGAPLASFTWTRPTVAGITSGASSGTGSISQALVNSTTAPVTVAYVYAVAASACTNSATFTVTFNVNPLPVLSSTLTPPNICGSTNFSYFATSATLGTGFSWTRPVVTGITSGGASTGTGVTIFQSLNNTNTSLTSVSYLFSLSANGCSNSQSISVGVYPTPLLSSSLTAPPVCSSTPFSYLPTSAIGTIFNWARTTVTGITNPAASGTNDPAETLINTTPLPVNVIYTYTVITSTGCQNTQTVTVTVNPTPLLSSSSAPPPICTGTLFNYTPTSNTPSTVFNWTRAFASPVSNGPASGSNSPGEILVNPSITPGAVVYSYTLTANACSNTQQITVTVNPIPVIAAQTTATCSNAAFTVTPAGVPVATVYTWGLPSITPVGSTLGSTTGFSQTAVNQVLNNQTILATSAVYIVLPSASGCNGNTFTLTVAINPTPVVANQSMTPVCSGSAFSYIATGIPAGTTYTWNTPVQNPSGTLTGAGAQPISQPAVSQTLSSINNLFDTAFYSVIPATALCIGNAFSLTVPVKPIPIIANLRDTICSGNTFGSNPSPVPASTTYTWGAPVSTPGGSILGGFAQSIPISNISQTLTNTTTAYAQAVYTIIPSAANCPGPAFLLTEVVARFIPVFTTQNVLICSGTAFNATPSSAPVGTTYTWPAPVNPPPVGITGGSATFTSVTSVSQVLTNQNNTIDTAIYTVTPVIGICPGTAFTATIRVLPLPKATITGPASICQNILIDTVSLALNGTAPWSFTYSDGITTSTKTGIASSPYKLVLPAPIAKNITTRTVMVMNVKDAGCSNTTDTSFFTQTINPLPVGKIISLHGKYLCNGIADTLFVQSIDSLGYQWKLNGALLTGVITDSIKTSTSGSYNALLTNVYGCSDTAAIPVSILLVKPPVLKFSVDTACINSLTTYTNLTDTTFTGTVQWLWSFGNGNSAVSMNGTTTYSIAGNYHVSLKATQPFCSSYLPVTLDSVINIQSPIADTTLLSVSATKGQITPVAGRSLPGYTYQWLPSAGIQNPDSVFTNFNYATTQQYTIQMVSPAGCVTHDSLLVRVFDTKVEDIFVPKSFTPNGDGINDILYPYIAGIKTFHYFRILNRYGKLLFETKNQDNGWDGKVNGVQQPMGVYFWVAEGVAADGSIVQKSGQILLLR